MTLAAGSVTISASGGETIVAGLAADIYAAMKTSATASFAAYGQSLPPAGPQLAATLGGLASMANAVGQTVITYIKTNGHAHITAGALGGGVPASDTDVPIL